MCRYAMTTYKPHYACFNCRKTFKRKLMWDIKRDNKDVTEAKCPQCGDLMANMGLDFESPKKDNIKEWNHIKELYSVGITFHSCGCSGPGYIPKDKDRLMAYFNEIINDYNKQLDFWRNRIEPKTEKEVQREISKHGESISRIPFEQRPEKETITNEGAKNYWLDRIKEVEQKLKTIKPAKNKVTV